MEEDKIKTLFGNFNPEISSGNRFVSRLERRLDSVEMVREHITKVRAQNRKAIAIASAVGFVAGFLFSLLLPWLGTVITEWQHTLADSSVLYAVADNYRTIAWILPAALSVFVALNTYEISLTLLTSRAKPRHTVTT